MTLPLCDLHKYTQIRQQVVVLHHTASMHFLSSLQEWFTSATTQNSVQAFQESIAFVSPRAQGLGTTAVNEEKAEFELEWWSMLSEPARPSPSCDIGFSVVFCLSIGMHNQTLQTGEP